MRRMWCENSRIRGWAAELTCSPHHRFWSRRSKSRHLRLFRNKSSSGKVFHPHYHSLRSRFPAELHHLQGSLASAVINEDERQGSLRLTGILFSLDAAEAVSYCTLFEIILFNRRHWPFITIVVLVSGIAIKGIVEPLAKWHNIADAVAVSWLTAWLLTIFVIIVLCVVSGSTRLVSVFNRCIQGWNLHHLYGLFILVDTVDVIASVVAGSLRFGTIHNEFAAVTASSLDKRSWMVSHIVNYSLVCHGCMARPDLEKAECSSKCELHVSAQV